MKIRFIQGGLAMALALFALHSCDKVDNPLPSDENTGTVVDTPFMGNDSLRKILIEDFTGQGCQGCPAANAEAEKLVKDFEGQVFAIAVHTGFFADPTSELGGNPYPQDFRTEAGEAYEMKTDWLFDSYPNGLLSRRPYNGEIVFDQNGWEDAINEINNDVPMIKIASSLEYDAATRLMSVTVASWPLMDLPSTYNLVLSFSENGVVAPQTFPGGSSQSDYVHNHLFRGNINGNWGVPIFSNDPPNQGSVDVKAYEFTLDDSWVAENMLLVVYVYDSATDEIIQVEEYHVTN